MISSSSRLPDDVALLMLMFSHNLEPIILSDKILAPNVQHTDFKGEVFKASKCYTSFCLVNFENSGRRNTLEVGVRQHLLRLL